MSITGNVYNLYEYKYAKSVVQELPTLIKSLDSMSEYLSDYTNNIDVVSLLWEINQTSLVLQAKLEYYNNVYRNKGRI